MNADNHAMTVANDAALAQMITQATRRLIIVVPGMSNALAAVLADTWRRLGPENVSITLDIDAEVCRLGYGEIDAVNLLSKAAAELQTVLHTHAGLRIGVIIADDETLIFAPTPLHIEAQPTADHRAPVKPNAIRVGLPPADLERDLGAGPDGVAEKTIGLDASDQRRITQVQADLDAAPAQPFNISRLLRVYTARLVFVELRLIGCKLDRRTIDVPPDLVGLVDMKMRQLLKSKFRLVDAGETGVWGSELSRIKEFIVDRFLVHIPGFGFVLPLREKSSFKLAVKILRKMLERARHRKCEALQATINRRIELMVNALLPAVTKHRPERWPSGLSAPDAATLLRNDLTQRAGTAHQLLGEARVELRYKGVTYETLNDPAFIRAVRKAIPGMRILHDEMQAAPAARKTQFPGDGA